MEAGKTFHPHVVMLPWLAIGHVVPYLELAKRLRDRGLRVRLCTTPTLLSFINRGLQQDGCSAIETAEIRLPPTAGLPSRHDSTASLPSHFMPLLKKAFSACKPAITEILTILRPDFLIHDGYPPWASDVAAELHIHAVQFTTFNASSMCTYYHFVKTGTMDARSGSPLESIDVADRQQEATDKIGSDEDAAAVDAFLRRLERPEYVLAARTVRSLEAKFLDYFREETGKAVLPIGTLLPRSQNASPPRSEFTDWLDAKGSASVVFVSFGSEYFMTKEQIAEIAFGLELSEQSFIWVIRSPAQDEDEEEDNVVERVLPLGFLERVKDRGMVVGGWAPQMAILSHPSTGGFLTHCGWGSLCEGMGCGVPFITLPLSIDQPINERLVLAELGLGMEVERESNREFRREMVCAAIRRVMAGEEGEELRRKGKQMAAKLENEGEEGIDELLGVMQRMSLPHGKEPMEETKAFRPRVLMLPWLALGHTIPHMELAKRLTDRGLRVVLCSTPTIISSLKQKLRQEGYSAIETIEFRLPPTPGLPSHHESTSSLPTHLMFHLKKAFCSCKPAITNILTTHNPDFIVHDFFPPWVPDLAAELHIRVIHFLTFNACTLSFFYWSFTKGTSIPSDSPVGSIKLQDFESRHLDRLIRKEQAELKAIGASPPSMNKKSILVCKTARSMEGKFLDYVQELTGKEVVPVGILAPQQQIPDKTEFTEWLDARRRASVVFVSFGSEYFMSREEIAEVAFGLELSEQSFIWVIRLAREEEEEEGESKVERVLPSGFAERVKHKGMVVNGWAPQTAILSHPSTGGFLTHCGWGSLCEGMGYGVPFIALPLNIDQPVNARLVVGELGLGVEVERDLSNGEFRMHKVAEAVRRVMVGEEGEKLRRNAQDMAAKIKDEQDGGVDELLRLMVGMHDDNEK
ncbi:unnamed protein product [Victoria cruziana]